MLHGRANEQERIAGLVAGAGAGRSAGLVLRGEPGVGKTALLDWAADLARVQPGPLLVLRGGGVESEAELPFAGLSQLLRPVWDRLDRLPARQRDVLAAAFGLAEAGRADRLIIGLAVLSLLAEAADDGPVLCLVDDAQWLDEVSAEALLLAARRLDAEGVVMLFAARDGAFSASGIPELTVAGLPPQEAARLLPADLDPVVRYRVLAEAQGNPLALLELPAVLADAPAAGPVPLTERLVSAFDGYVSALPAATRALLLVTAADDTGDLSVILRAAEGLGAGPDDLRPAETARLVQLAGDRLAFRHPLVRAAVYQQTPYARRLAAHRALADALTGGEMADRRAWHLAAAAIGPDEEVARALESTAEQARTRNGYGAAAAAFERSAQLTEDRAAQARRLLLAAESGLSAGNLAGAVRLAERASGLVDDSAMLARISWVEGLAWFWQGAHQTAYDLMAAGAELDGRLRARLLVQAFHPAWYLGEPQLGRCLDRLAGLDHPLARFEVAAVRGRPPALSATAAQLGEHLPDLIELTGLGFVAGQDAEALELAAQLVVRCRLEGSVGLLPTLLFFLAEAQLFHGRHRDAVISLDEALAVARDGDQPQWQSQLLAVRAVLAAVEGDGRRCHELVAASRSSAAAGTDPAGQPWTLWALGLLELGQGRPEAALPRLAALQIDPYAHQVCAHRCVPDLVEAAVRAGVPDRAQPAFDRFTAWAQRTGQPWARSLVHRCRALLSGAEDDYRSALDGPARPFERARTHLLYGEWLRRARRKAEARRELHEALAVFDQLGAEPWAARTRAEVATTGLPMPAGRQSAPRAVALTPQELQIARLAAQGLSNKDIAAQLFLSPKTVAYHLYKAYPKLGVTGRAELVDALERME